MTTPTGRDVHVDGLLTNISIAYINDNYIADQVFPIVPVMNRSGIVPKYDQSHWFRNLAALRAPGTASMRGGYKVDVTDTYYANRYSFGKEIADEDRDNTDSPFNLDRDAAEFCTDKIQMAKEIAFASAFFTTGVWGTDGTIGTGWDTYASTDPMKQIDGWNDTVQGKIARRPNTFVMGRQVWTALKWHPDVVGIIQYVREAIATPQLLARAMDFDRVLIGDAIYTTTAEGTAETSVSYTRAWGKHTLLLYVPPRPSLMNPAAGYTFTWNRVPNSIRYVVRHRDAEREVDIIEANTYFDQKLTAKNAGHFTSSCVS